MALRISIRNSYRSSIPIHTAFSAHGFKVNRSIRAMSTAPTEKIDWLVILPDHEGALARRMEVRPSHLSAIKPQVESGFWKMGGAMLEEVPKEGEGLKIMGSVMMAHATTKEEVMEALKQDVYFKSNIWDMEKVQIYPVSENIAPELPLADSYMVQNGVPQSLTYKCYNFCGHGLIPLQQMLVDHNTDIAAFLSNIDRDS